MALKEFLRSDEKLKYDIDVAIGDYYELIQLGQLTVKQTKIFLVVRLYNVIFYALNSHAQKNGSFKVDKSEVYDFIVYLLNICLNMDILQDIDDF